MCPEEDFENDDGPDTADEFQSGFYCRFCSQIIDGDEPGYPRDCGCGA